jgi:alpha-L-fucosidase 2
MFDAHPPFQIDGNFGGAAGIAEMLVLSRGDLIDLLPALPRAWPEGRIAGVRVRGAGEIDLEWRGGVVSRLRLRAAVPGSWRIRAGSSMRRVTLGGGEVRDLMGPELAD